MQCNASDDSGFSLVELRGEPFYFPGGNNMLSPSALPEIVNGLGHLGDIVNQVAGAAVFEMTPDPLPASLVDVTIFMENTRCSGTDSEYVECLNQQPEITGWGGVRAYRNSESWQYPEQNDN